jgi:hypothetical protein
MGSSDRVAGEAGMRIRTRDEIRGIVVDARTTIEGGFFVRSLFVCAAMVAAWLVCDFRQKNGDWSTALDIRIVTGLVIFGYFNFSHWKDRVRRE